MEEANKTEDNISLLDIFMVIAKNVKMIVIFTFLAGVVIVLLSILSIKLPSDSLLNFFPNRYKPEAVVLLKTPGSGQGGFSSLFNGSEIGSLVGILGGGITGSSDIGELVKVLIYSDEAADFLVNKFKLIQLYEIEKFPKSSSRKIIKERLSFEIDTVSNTAIVSYLDTDPALATEIVNELIIYIEKKVRLIYLEKTYEKKNFLEDRLSIKEAEFSKLQNDLIEFQKEYGVMNVDSLTNSSVSLISELQTEIITKERRLKSMQKLSPHLSTEIGILQYEIDSTQSLINELKQGGEDFPDNFIPLDTLPDIIARYLNLKQDLSIQGVILEMLKQQYEAVKIEESDKSQTFQILQLAEIPEVKSEPRRSLLTIITVFAVFVIMVFISFIKEYLENIKKDPQENEKLLQIRKMLLFWTRSKSIKK